MHDGFEYDVTLSFAGEDRDTVEQFAAILRKSGLRVFYDEWEQANLWGKDLYQHLDAIYSKQARFCVIFVSKHYAEKAWTNHELKSAQARMFEGGEYLLPLKLDDTTLPGMRSTLGYIDLRKTTIEKVAETAVKKVRGALSESEPKRVIATGGKLKLKKKFTEQDRDDFLDRCFEEIAEYFRNSLVQIETGNPGYVGKYRQINSNHFTAVIYLNGSKVAQCGIRLHGSSSQTFREQIVYSGEPESTNSMNEGLSVENGENQLYLRASGMSSYFGGAKKEVLNSLNGAELFWELLTKNLR